jgi:hypothetical protein
VANNSIDLRSLERLKDFHNALVQFANRADGRISRLESQFSRARDYLSKKHTAFSHRVDMLEQMLYQADEECDTSQIEEKLDEARADLDRAIQCEAHVDAAESRYRQHLARVQAVLRSGIPEARNMLERKIGQLHDVLGVPVNHAPGRNSSVGSILSSAAMNSLEEVQSSDHQFATEPRPYSPIMQFYSLPSGFRWISLDSIAPADLEKARIIPESKKTSFAEMRKGFAVLQQEILPALASMSASQAYERFAAEDASAPRPDGLFRQNVFAAFFGGPGKANIHLEKKRSDSFFTVIDGQHRIRVAMELGWEAIPAEAVEVE